MEMHSLKLVLRFRTHAATPLHSDTVFGHFCWGYRYLEGGEALAALLADYDTRPACVFSAGLPAGMLPVPCLGPVTEEEGDVRLLKRRAYMRVETLRKVREAASAAAVAALLAGEEDGGADHHGDPTHVRVRNTVDRRTGTTAGTGGVYMSEVRAYGARVVYCVYRPDVLSPEKIGKVFEYVGRTGFGGKRSVGLGCFDVEDVVEAPEETAPLEGADCFMSLSHGLPGEGEELVFGATYTKCGRHGDVRALGNTPFKNPVVTYAPGSTFSFSAVKPVYGRALGGVSAYRDTVCSAYMVPFFMKREVRE